MMRFSAVLAWGFAREIPNLSPRKDADKLFQDVAHDVSHIICRSSNHIQPLYLFWVSMIYMLCCQRENSLDVEDDQVKTALEIKAVVSHHPGCE
jgi:hypothetical protein